MASWKTTVGGILTAIGLFLAAVPDPQWVHFLGLGLAGLGAAFTGAVARDNNVSSEAAGAK